MSAISPLQDLYEQACKSREEMYRILQATKRELDEAKRTIELKAQLVEDQRERAVAAERDRDMWLNDDARQNSALGRAIARAEIAEAEIIKMRKLPSVPKTWGEMRKTYEGSNS